MVFARNMVIQNYDVCYKYGYLNYGFWFFLNMVIQNYGND